MYQVRVAQALQVATDWEYLHHPQVTTQISDTSLSQQYNTSSTHDASWQLQLESPTCPEHDMQLLFLLCCCRTPTCCTSLKGLLQLNAQMAGPFTLIRRGTSSSSMRKHKHPPMSIQWTNITGACIRKGSSRRHSTRSRSSRYTHRRGDRSCHHS